MDSRKESSKQKHTSMTKDFEAFSLARGVDPRVVTFFFDAHVANFYRARLRGVMLPEATQKAISAAMMDYFSAIKFVGPWQTGRDANGCVVFSGHPNLSDDVKKAKSNHLKALATRGDVFMSVDPLEVVQAAAFWDEHFSGCSAIDPVRLSDYSLELLAMSLLLRYDEASKVKYAVYRIALHVFSASIARFVGPLIEAL